jgi:hypothetical protein
MNHIAFFGIENQDIGKDPSAIKLIPKLGDSLFSEKVDW